MIFLGFQRWHIIIYGRTAFFWDYRGRFSVCPRAIIMPTCPTLNITSDCRKTAQRHNTTHAYRYERTGDCPRVNASPAYRFFDDCYILWIYYYCCWCKNVSPSADGVCAAQWWRCFYTVRANETFELSSRPKNSMDKFTRNPTDSIKPVDLVRRRFRVGVPTIYGRARPVSV